MNFRLGLWTWTLDLDLDCGYLIIIFFYIFSPRSSPSITTLADSWCFLMQKSLTMQVRSLKTSRKGSKIWRRTNTRIGAVCLRLSFILFNPALLCTWLCNFSIFEDMKTLIFLDKIMINRTLSFLYYVKELQPHYKQFMI